MKNKILIFIAFLGMISFFACEKDETRAILDASPTAPVLEAVNDMVLKRDNSTDSITISGSEANFGYQASVEYILEAGLAGTEFADPIELGKEELVNTFKFTVSSLNNILIATLPEDELSALELRVRAVIISSNTGGSDPIESSSEALAVNITTYGPPSLYITGDAYSQRLVSANNDGIYSGWIYTDGTAFTLTNRDDGKIYGETGGVVTENGDSIALAEGGWNLEVNLNTNVLTSGAENWGIIGSAIPPYDWSVDVDMTYNITEGVWEVTGDFVAGEYKFRANDDWALNLGDDGADGSLEEGAANIALAASGNYTITLNHFSRTYSVVKN